MLFYHLPGFYLKAGFLNPHPLSLHGNEDPSLDPKTKNQENMINITNI